MISLGNFCSFSETLSLCHNNSCNSLEILSLCHSLCEVYQMLPQHQAHDIFSQVMSSANSQRSFFLFYPVTKTTYQASSSSSQLESLTRSSSFLLHILVVHFPRCVSFLSSFMCILSCLSPPQEGSGPVLFLLSEGNSGQSGPAVKTSLCGTSG
jgi:hypothetical protein